MLYHAQLENVIFIDIETVPAYKSFEDIPEPLQQLWIDKFGKKLDENETIQNQYFNNAGIYAEFGKIICISVGFVNIESSQKQLRIKSFYAHEEQLILQSFANLLQNKHFQPADKFYFCGHNINEFDIPYLCRRMLVHQIQLPSILDISGKKPWEIKNVDTMVHWKFGDFKNYTSLKLLTALFQIQTPKDDISGKDVGRVYWEENDLERIRIYCQKDVLAVAQLFQRYKMQPLIGESEIVYL